MIRFLPHFRIVSALPLRFICGIATLILGAVAIACTPGRAPRDEAVSTMWHSHVAIAGVERPGCDTVRVAHPAATCGGGSNATAEDLSVLAARASVLVSQRASTPAPDITNELGRMELLLARDSAGIDRAIDLLREAVDLDSSNVDYAIDYSAALLSRYATNRAIRDLLEAVNLTAALVERDPAACWNHAVGLAWLGVREEGAVFRARCVPRCAKAGCRLPVIQDGAPALASNANATASTGRFPDAAWDYVWMDALPRWGKAVGDGDTVAARLALGDARTGAGPLAQRGIDSSGLQEVAQLLGPLDSTERAGRARAVELFAEARRSRQLKGARTASALLDSVEARTEAKDPIRRWSALQRGNTLLTTGQPRAALDHYRSLGAGRLPVATMMGSRLAFNEALALMALGSQLESVDRLERIAGECLRVERAECALAAAGMAAGINAQVGDFTRREVMLQVALEASDAPIGDRRWLLLSELRQVAEGYRLPRAVSLLLAEGIRTAEALNRPELRVEDLTLKAAEFAEAGMHDSLSLAIDDARALWTTRLTGREHALYAGELAWLSGELLLMDRKPAAIDSLDVAISRMAGDTNAVRSVKPRFAHARAVLQRGDTARALRDLDLLLADTERLARSTQSPFRRARLRAGFARAAGLAAGIVRQRGDNIALYRVLSGQPRYNVDSIEESAGMHPKALRRRGSESATTAGIAFRRVADSVFIWESMDGKTTLRVVSLPAREIEAVVRTLDNGALEKLYAQLLGPYISRLSATEQVVRVDARNDLTGVPWPALRDLHGGRFAVERAAFVLVNDLFGASESDQPLHPPVVLIDAAPRGGESSLAGATAEIRSLREVWGRSAHVIDGGTGRAEVLRIMQRSSVVHFAGHAVFDGLQPERSYLRLAGAAHDSTMTATDIAAADLSGVQLIIVAACDARRAGLTARDGMESLAGALRLSGARQVIAASWAVDDQITRSFMELLHRQLARGLSPTLALRAAQEESLRSANAAQRAPRAWAAFQLLGW